VQILNTLLKASKTEKKKLFESKLR